ncbi:hypothetical protein [Methyloprofundus sp.]|uniref:hypothetical protein n=1 Tax=Methyloprofundus sp. TaxID=2020875 RepID=UPI003D0EA8BA
MPWYSTHGNHDGTVVGYFRALAPQLALYWDQIATGNVPDFGSVMFLDLPTGMSIDTFEDCLGFPTPTCVTSIYENRVTREVPANEDRAQYLTAKFLDMHFQSPALPGPVGHGFTEQNIADNTLYYSFDMSDEVVGIVLDTVNISGEDGGSIGTNQQAWFAEQLQLNSSKYLDSSGNVVTTDNPDKLIVIFSHHNLMTMDNSTSMRGDPDPVKVLAADIEKLVLNYPNVILWVNGHSHVNRIWSHRSFNSTALLIPGFWEVNTASHIDYPQQGRSIEIVDNKDGTLSIFGIIFDHLAPPKPNAANLNILNMASISRELSVNDPDFNLAFQLGEPADLNVELLIKKPF